MCGTFNRKVARGCGVEQAIGSAAAMLGYTLRVLLIVGGWVRPLIGPTLVAVALWWIYPPAALLAIGLALTVADRWSR